MRSTPVPFAVRRVKRGRTHARWQVMRVGDSTVITEHRRRSDALFACAKLVEAGADPGPMLTVQEIDARRVAECEESLPLFGGVRPVGGCECSACEEAAAQLGRLR
jgi:hypothetical protein